MLHLSPSAASNSAPRRTDLITTVVEATLSASSVFCARPFRRQPWVDIEREKKKEKKLQNVWTLSFGLFAVASSYFTSLFHGPLLGEAS